MDNAKKYLKIFVDVLEVAEDKVLNLNYRDVPAWDSVGHMTLIAEIESEFDVMLDTEEIIDFNSFEKGKEILSNNYGVEF
ncbi:MAG: acyl carrier protein [Epulopiscium sp. Nuni2H_MBin003]|nr:MAG: acyl carrier protein [Epulopiscium sp. Nuni2H_MBin003]